MAKRVNQATARAVTDSLRVTPASYPADNPAPLDWAEQHILAHRVYGRYTGQQP